MPDDQNYRQMIENGYLIKAELLPPSQRLVFVVLTDDFGREWVYCYLPQKERKESVTKW